MVKNTIAPLVAPFAVVTLAMGQGSSLETIVSAYDQAKWPDREMRAAVTPNQTRSLLHRSTNSHAQAAAIHYYLASVLNSDQEVTLMVREALRDSGADARQALPDALQSLWTKGHRSRAFQRLIDLKLDGGPAETLSRVRIKLCFSDPNQVGDVLFARLGSVKRALARKSTPNYPPIDTFVADLDSELANEPKLRKKLLASLQEKSGHGCSFLRKIVQGITPRR